MYVEFPDKRQPKNSHESGDDLKTAMSLHKVDLYHRNKKE